MRSALWHSRQGGTRKLGQNYFGASAGSVQVVVCASFGVEDDAAWTLLLM